LSLFFNLVIIIHPSKRACRGAKVHFLVLLLTGSFVSKDCSSQHDIRECWPPVILVWLQQQDLMHICLWF